MATKTKESAAPGVVGRRKRRTPTIPLGAAVLAAGLIRPLFGITRRCACYQEGYDAGFNAAKEVVRRKINEMVFDEYDEGASE